MGNKKYYPSKNKNNQKKYGVNPYQKKHYPVSHQQKSANIAQGFFNGNLASNMKFGSPGDHLSGYVRREIVIKDRHGNETRASERQFFNSGKDYNIKINDHGRKEKY
jgi:hypothetical protein